MATTGIAAINLGDAVTINSQLGYFDTANMKSKVIDGYIQQRLRRMRAAGVRRLVLDEVSMMDAEQLTMLCRALDDVNGEVTTRDDTKREPIGLTLVGDFLQLPPVDGKFAFESPEWGRFQVETLTANRRQSDPDFLTALRAARVGDGATLAAYFASRLQDFNDTNFDGTTILAKNAAVDQMNRMRHDALPGTPIAFLATRWGTERGEWKNVPVQLLLKPGAKVMILANRYEGSHGERELVYANGDLGTFLGKNEDGSAAVELERCAGSTVKVQWVTRQHERALDKPRYVCSNKDCNTDARDGHQKTCDTCGARIQKVSTEVIGELTYLPLRLAYASTVHKVQGLTLDSVQIGIRDPFFATPGMTYVALSRARNPEKLRVVGTVEMLKKRCVVDPRVSAWR